MPRTRPYSPAEAAEHSKAMRRALATPERAARRMEVARRFRAGESIYAIAKGLGIDRTTVTKDLERIAPDALAAYRAKLAARKVERRGRNVRIRRAHGRGESLTSIADKHGISHQRVAQVLTVKPLPDAGIRIAGAKMQDAPLDQPERPCRNCGAPFRPTKRRRMLCAPCFRGPGVTIMSTIAPNPMPELAPLLKRLRLSGILDSLETRNREAVANKIPYTDFLALLIADEVARREHKKFNLRIRRAGFRSSKTIEQFDFDFNPAIDQTLIADLATCRFVAEKVAVLIAGPCGTGKSHIAQALGYAAVRADYDVLFTTQSQLLASLNAARAINAYERRFHAFARVPLLVIDDFGLKPLRAPQDEDFHHLVAERYEQGATIVTSNLDFSEWGDAFPNRLLGAATLDRLRHGAYRLTLEGESYRSPRPMPGPRKSTVATGGKPKK